MVLAASIFALASIETPDAQAKQQCRAAIPSNQHGYWSYRIIDERKCWYEGKPMLSKDLLEWPSEERGQEAKREPKPETKQESKEGLKEGLKRESRQEPKQESKQESKQALKQEPGQESKQALKQEPRQAAREQAKEQAKEQVKEQAKETLAEDAFAPPAFRTKPDRAAAEKPRNPLDAQAFAPQDGDTFEALWRVRIQDQSLR
jgi:outer membrane biosynthesis protein TonB